MLRRNRDPECYGVTDCNDVTERSSSGRSSSWGDARAGRGSRTEAARPWRIEP
jgi:hypothetical protein